MSKQKTFAVQATLISFLLGGIAFAGNPEPVHTITDDSPAVGEKGKVMLYGVVLEKAPVSQRVNRRYDTRQTLEQTDSESR